MEVEMAGSRVEIIRALTYLRESGSIEWAAQERGWVGEPEDILRVLAGEGFEEYKHEVTRGGRGQRPTGGLWQGLNSRTGAVGSAVWVLRENADRPLVFVEVDGQPVQQ